MRVEIIGKTRGLTKVAATAAAICYDATNAEKSLKAALSSGHESVAEHQSYTFSISRVSRVLLAQLTRHRMASYSVQSQRYCGIDIQMMDVIIPPSVRKAGMADRFRYQAAQAFDFYQEMVEVGVPEEDARYIIPQGIETSLIVTMNARELRHFFALRMCNRAQWEIRELADQMYSLCVKDAPELFDNAGPGCCTKAGCPEGKRSCGYSRLEEVKELRWAD